ncbi:hypothetical protein IWX49DRAFT_119231 [Phyllosticta citricarpa]
MPRLCRLRQLLACRNPASLQLDTQLLRRATHSFCRLVLDDSKARGRMAMYGSTRVLPSRPSSSTSCHTSTASPCSMFIMRHSILCSFLLLGQVSGESDVQMPAVNLWFNYLPFSCCTAPILGAMAAWLKAGELVHVSSPQIQHVFSRLVESFYWRFSSRYQSFSEIGLLAQFSFRALAPVHPSKLGLRTGYGNTP